MGEPCWLPGKVALAAFFDSFALSDEDYSPSYALLFTVALIGSLAFVQVYSVQAILPVLLRDLQATVVQGGYMVGATVLAVALVSPFMGMCSDAVGRKSLIVLSIFFLGLASVMAGPLTGSSCRHSRRGSGR